MAIPVELDKLRHAGVYTTWMYTIAPDPVTRPQRGFRESDMSSLSEIVQEISNEYNIAKKDLGKKANFDACRNRVLNIQKWASELERNLYTSIIMTYFRWRQKRFANEYIKKHLYLERLWHFMLLTK